ncbi:unnamed protein product, partial [marine sediment metagenome]
VAIGSEDSDGMPEDLLDAYLDLHKPDKEFLIEPESKDLKIGSIRIPDNIDAGGDLSVSINLGNDYMEELKDIKVTVVIPELGLRKQVGPFDLDDESKKLVLEIPEYVNSGEYVARIVISNDKIRRVKHRIVVVE